MNCSEFKSELELLVESRCAELSDGAKAHADHCATCRQQWQEQRLVDQFVRSLTKVDPPSGMAERIVQALLADHLNSESVSPDTQSQTPYHRTGRSGRDRMIVAVAAMVCFVTIGGLGMLFRGEPTGERIVKNERGLPDEPAVEVESSVAEVFHDLKAEYREIAAETGASARDFAQILPQEWKPTVPTIDALGMTDPSPRGSQSLTHLGRSIGSQIGEAMDFLWATVPESVPRG